MDITITISLTLHEETEIAAILGCSAADLQDRLTACSLAAMKEYLAMFRGQKTFKRGSDMLEYRLLLLIENAFDGVIPDERKVSSLFQTTLTESRSLIRSVISKYQYQVKSHVERTLKLCLSNARRTSNTQNYTAIINSQSVIDELNKALAGIDGNLPSVIKKKGTVSTFEISPASYNELCTQFSVVPNP